MEFIFFCKKLCFNGEIAFVRADKGSESLFLE